jgi:NTP pyrophosphatase (non-canonical NTP hydrolase)
MHDARTTVEELKQLVAAFVQARHWEPYHSPKNLAMALAVEAAELMEPFLWQDAAASHEVAQQPAVRQAVADELADILFQVLNLCNVLALDLSEAVRAKLVKNATKYPAAQPEGS